MMMMMGCHNNHDLKMKKIRQETNNNNKKKLGQNVCCSAVQTYHKTKTHTNTQTFEYFCKVFFSFKKKKFGKFFFLKFYFLFRIISINLTPNTLYKIMFFKKQTKTSIEMEHEKKPKLIFITSLVHACVCAETNFFLKWKKIQFIFIIKIKSTVFFSFFSYLI